MQKQRPLTPRQKKQVIAAIDSILGNIRAHLPGTENDFKKSLETHYPELAALREEEDRSPREVTSSRHRPEASDVH